MTAQDRLDVVAVGAHPDDVEIGCGGTLLCAHAGVGSAVCRLSAMRITCLGGLW